MSTDGRGKPLCLVLIPSGLITDQSGTAVDFDAVYDQIVEPAIGQAGMAPIRADRGGAAIDAATWERLLVCEHVVVDVTAADPSAFFALGVRYAMRPGATLAVFWSGARPVPEVSPVRTVPYALQQGRPAAADEEAIRLSQALRSAPPEPRENELYRLIDDVRPAEIARLKTDVFRDEVAYSEATKERLGAARAEGGTAVAAMAEELGDPAGLEFGIVIDLFLSYRAVRGWQQMVDLVDRMPPPLARSVMVREQLALALNRLGRGADAERVLLDLLDERGPSSETYALLGRVYKDRWQTNRDEGKELAAIADLSKAIEAYVKGFETDWRDAYPGVNAVTLMEYAHLRDPRQAELLPVVRYSAMRRIASGEPDYWDHATLLELAVLAADEAAATRHCSDAVTEIREPWEPETTLRNLRLIGDARTKRGDATEWILPILAALEEEAGAAAR